MYFIYCFFVLYISRQLDSKTIITNNYYQPINCDSLNSNYILSSKSFAKDEMISTKNLSMTNVTKNSVNSEPFSNSKSSLNDQYNLGSNLHRVRIENLSRIIFGQLNINSVRVICL